MQLKELIDTMAYGTHYKLIGAKTGKHLADSITNKEGYIKAFWEEDVSGFFPSFDTQKKTTLQRFRNTSDRLSAFGLVGGERGCRTRLIPKT